jgi:ecotropic viral integration site 5 protein
LINNFPNLYNKLVEKGETNYEIYIKKDLPRTFPQYEYFSNNGEGQEKLYNILKSFAFFENTIGYSQGMAFIAG